MSEHMHLSLDSLQDEVHQDMLAQCSKELLQRLKDAPFQGVPKNPSCSGKNTGSCGDTIEIFLRIEDQRITDAGFQVNGCGFSLVSASACCEVAIGRTLEEAMSVSKEDVLELLGRLPDEEAHCAYLAAKTLEAAVHDWMVKHR